MILVPCTMFIIGNLNWWPRKYNLIKPEERDFNNNENLNIY